MPRIDRGPPGEAPIAQRPTIPGCSNSREGGGSAESVELRNFARGQSRYVAPRWHEPRSSSVHKFVTERVGRGFDSIAGADLGVDIRDVPGRRSSTEDERI